MEPSQLCEGRDGSPFYQTREATEWGVKCMEPLERLTLNGVEYVRADLIPQVQPSRMERTYSVQEIEDLTGVSYQSVYRAVRSGRLQAVYPNGTRRGMRIKESEYLRWIETSTCESS